MSDEIESHKDRKARQRAYVDSLIAKAEASALVRIELSVGDTVHDQHHLFHRIPTNDRNKYFPDGEWHYAPCPGDFTVSSVTAKGGNTSGSNDEPVIEATAYATLTCNDCGREATVTLYHGYGNRHYHVNDDPALPA